MKYSTISLETACLFHCRNLSQLSKKLSKSASIQKNNLTFCTVTSNKNLYQVSKNQISVAESLMVQRFFHIEVVKKLVGNFSVVFINFFVHKDVSFSNFTVLKTRSKHELERFGNRKTTYF